MPDFQKLGIEHHARTVHRLWDWLSQGDGHIPQDWFAGQIARLDNVQGDIDTLAGRMAAVRIWSYVAQRSDWLANPVEMAARARALEERLSDALHGALRQRFVDKRTAVLMRGSNIDSALLPVDVGPKGAVTVDGEMIGRLAGFRFIVDPTARAGERRLLLAAAERRLGKHLNDKAQTLLADSDQNFTLAAEPGGEPGIIWQEDVIATLRAGKQPLAPEIILDKGLATLAQDVQQSIRDRLDRWIAAQLERHVPALLRMDAAARDADIPATVRAVLAQIVDAGGIAARRTLDESLNAVSKEDRAHLRKAGVFIGVLDIYHPGLIKPGGALWRMALFSLYRGRPLVALPPAGAVLLPSSDDLSAVGARIGGFRQLGDIWLRIDIAERIARGAHEAIAKALPYTVMDPAIVSIGLSEPAFLDLMRQAGFRAINDPVEGSVNWAFKGRPKRPVRPSQARKPKEGGGARKNDRDATKASGDGKSAQGKRPGNPAPKSSAPSRTGQAIATGKALAGLGALLGRED